MDIFRFTWPWQQVIGVFLRGIVERGNIRYANGDRIIEFVMSRIDKSEAQTEE